MTHPTLQAAIGGQRAGTEPGQRRTRGRRELKTYKILKKPKITRLAQRAQGLGAESSSHGSRRDRKEPEGGDSQPGHNS